jgi:hypothetical protein
MLIQFIHENVGQQTKASLMYTSFRKYEIIYYAENLSGYLTLARLLGPGGIRSVVAESVLVKQQLLILARSRPRSLNLHTSDRLVAGLCTLFMHPGQLIRSGLEGRTPEPGIEVQLPLSFHSYGWQKHCRGCIRHPSRHDSAALTLEHDRESTMTRLISRISIVCGWPPALIHRAFNRYWDRNPLQYFRNMVPQAWSLGP